MKRALAWFVFAASVAACSDAVVTACDHIKLGQTLSSVKAVGGMCLPSGGLFEVGPIDDLWCCNAGREFNQSLADGGCAVDCSLPQFAPFQTNVAGPAGQSEDGIDEACCVLSRDGGVIGHFVDQD